MIRIEFSTASRSFDDSVSPGSFWYETSNVLEQVVLGLDKGGNTGGLFDTEENYVGHWVYEED